VTRLSDEERHGPLAWYVRLCWAAVFTVTGLCALAWWVLMPSAFAVAHPRFWSNAVFPWVWLATAVLGIHGCVRPHPLLQWLALAPFAALLSALVAIRWSHPVTATSPYWWCAVGLASLLGGLAFVTMRGRARASQLLPVLAFVGLGAAFALSLRAPPASTRPLGRPERGEALAMPGDGVVTYEHGRVRLQLATFLTFGSRSPDGAWTLFAPRNAQEPGATPLCALFGSSFGAAGPLQIEAECELVAPISSHLNDYASLRVSGHKRLSIAFSPIADEQLDFLPSDYPAGRPLRFAYLGPNDVFRVVEADSAEKGPFRELASGHLHPGEALTMTLFDEGEARLNAKFLDWTAQLSIGVSPSAGWGVPQNAVSFRRLGDGDNSPCEIALTLASTGIGRGFDSVTHAAGVYRNRIEIGVPAL
jgi:hypothetical protein